MLNHRWRVCGGRWEAEFTLSLLEEFSSLRRIRTPNGVRLKTAKNG